MNLSKIALTTPLAAIIVFLDMTMCASAASYTYEHRKLPAGYKAVKYVKSGKGYVNLDIIANGSYGLSMETVMGVSSTPGDRMFCGAVKVKYGYNGIGLLRYKNNIETVEGETVHGGWGYTYGRGVSTHIELNGSNYYVVKSDLDPVFRSLQIWDDTGAHIVDTQTRLEEADPHGEDIPLYLFADNSAYDGSPSVFDSFCYMFKLWQVDEQGTRTLVRDLEPCVREEDGEAGLWDFVRKEFLCSPIASKLSAGPDLPRNRCVSATGTWYCEDDESAARYTTLGAALADFSTGDVIWLQDGFVETNDVVSFTENKTFTRRVRVKVDKEDVVIRSESGVVNEAAGKGATIRGVGFSVTDGVTNWVDAVSCLYVTKTNFTLRGVILENGVTSYANDTDARGGGLYVGAPAGLTVSNCVIRNCVASGSGGGAYSTAAGLVYRNCTITNNIAIAGSGGGARGGDFYDSTVSFNVAYDCGGGVMHAGDDVHVFSNCTFVGNSLLRAATSAGQGMGGGVCLYGSSSRAYVKGVLVDCLFATNKAPYCGGGYYGAGSAVRCQFVGNSAGRGAGASGRQPNSSYPEWDYPLHATDCLFEDNTARTMGAGFYLGSATNCIIRGNYIPFANLLYAPGAGALDCDLVGCVVSNNTAEAYYLNGSAAGVSTENGITNFCYNTLIVGNVNRGSGVGGAYADTRGSLTLVNCTVADNTCTREFGEKSVGAGGLMGKVTLVNSIAANNASPGLLAKNADSIVAATNSCVTFLKTLDDYPGCVTDDPKLDARYAPHRKSCRNSALPFGWMADPNDARSKDVYGAARVQGKGPDMGAVETPDYGLMMIVR